jgi:hypothetical protein
MEKHRTLHLTIGNAGEMPRALWDGLDGFPFDDNGDAPDGDWLPAGYLDGADAGVQTILDGDYGEIVDAMYFDSGREVVEWSSDWPNDPASEPLTEWFETASEEEIAEEGWNIAQNLGVFATRYSSSGIIVVANPLPAES